MKYIIFSLFSILLIVGGLHTKLYAEMPSAEDFVEIDEKYEQLKRDNTWETFQIAKRRLKEAPPKTMPFAHYVAVYDALSITEKIRADWLSKQQRKEYLEWRSKAEKALMSSLDRVEPVSEEQEKSPTKNLLEEADILVNEALEDAYEEDLTLIANARPNGKIEEALEHCREAMRLLEGDEYGKGFGESSLAKWDEVRRQIQEAIQKLQVRQKLKYSMWAENIFRAARKNISASDEKLKDNYLSLAQINLSLVKEPSLTKEITQLMYEIYERLESDSKTSVRYKSIMQLEARKQVNEF